MIILPNKFNANAILKETFDLVTFPETVTDNYLSALIYQAMYTGATNGLGYGVAVLPGQVDNEQLRSIGEKLEQNNFTDIIMYGYDDITIEDLENLPTDIQEQLSEDGSIVLMFRWMSEDEVGVLLEDSNKKIDELMSQAEE